jgi:hypothetical protein
VVLPWRRPISTSKGKAFGLVHESLKFTEDGRGLEKLVRELERGTMSSIAGFLDEQGMMDLARKAIENLERDGISPKELKGLENILNVGKALMLSSFLKTIRDEIWPDASQKKLPGLGRMLRCLR